MEGAMSSEASTGYLQDAVVQWSERCKRRRLDTSTTHEHAVAMAEDIQQLLQFSQWQGVWDSSCNYEDPLENLNWFVEDNSNVSGNNLQNCTPQLQQDPNSSPPSSSGKQPIMPQNSRNSIIVSLKGDQTLTDEELEEEKRRKKKKKVVYPFAVLKPVGLEGDVTLDDINERILMRPTRPVKHPVGEFASGPCVSAGGPGLSGKAVVGLRKIHTQGRGSITIIRTKE